MLRAADEIGTWLIAIVATVGVGLLGRHWLRDRRPYGDPLDGWLFMGAGAAWLAIVPSSLDLVDWTFPGRDVVSALLLLATVPLLVAGAMVEALRRSSSGLEQTSHRVLEWVLLAAGIAVVYTGLVGGLGSLFGKNGPTWFLVATTGAIALIAEPDTASDPAPRRPPRVRRSRRPARRRATRRRPRRHRHGRRPAPGSRDQSRAGAPPRLGGHRHRGSRWLAAGGVGRSRDRTPSRGPAPPSRRRRRPVGRRVDRRTLDPAPRSPDPRAAGRPARPRRELGPAGRRSAAVERRGRLGPRGGTPPAAARPARRPRPDVDRSVARDAHGRASARPLDRRPAQRTAPRAPRTTRRRDRLGGARAQADRARPATHRTRPTRPRRRARRVHAQVRRRPRDPSGAPHRRPIRSRRRSKSPSTAS